MKIALVTLGCPKNTVDSEVLTGSLSHLKIRFVAPENNPDVIIINTCGFIQSAKEEAIETILQAFNIKEKGLCQQVFVVGCLVNRYAGELEKEFPEVDAFFEHRNLENMIGQVARRLGFSDVPVHRRKLLTPPHFAYLKIAEGCNNFCSYCAIPIIRGPLVSRSPDNIVLEAQKLIHGGVRELLVIAQDITNYGRDLNGTANLIQLIRRIVAIPDLMWLRLMYTHPAHLSDELIDTVASSDKICKYFDLPIQHISNRILKKMNRQIQRSQVESLVRKIRDRIPEAALRTSLIVGFPGETEEEFKELLDFVTLVRFDRLGAFAYSREEGTPAYRFKNHIPPEVINERLDEIMAIQTDISLSRNEKLIGSIVKVLTDEYDEATRQFMGRTQWDAPEIDNVVRIEGHAQIKPGQFYDVRITNAFEFDLVGRI